MSQQDHALNEAKLTDTSPAPGKVLEVIVRPRFKQRLFPETITLTNGVRAVRWSCSSLARGARLQIHFPHPQDPKGPFIVLEARAGTLREVVGLGNRGPRDTLKEYTYEARILGKDGEVRVVGTGRVINEATKKILAVREGLGDPPVGPPQKG